MSSDKRLWIFKRSTVTQFFLVIIIVIIAGLVLFIYPDPYVPLRVEDKNRLFARTVLVSSLGGSENNLTHLVAGVEIRLDLVTSSGLRNVLTTETNSSGVVELQINSGTYRITVKDWWRGYVLINKPTDMNITKYDFTKQPSSIDIFSLSKNWTIFQGDIIEASFTNKLDLPIQIESVFIGDQVLSKAHQEVLPAAEWQGSYTVPSNVSIPWSVVNRSLIVALQISYTEVNIDS